MRKWQTMLALARTNEAMRLEDEGYEPIGTAISGVDRSDAVPRVLYRRRVPAPLKPCEGCVFARSEYRAERGQTYTQSQCRAHPVVVDVDGTGCGERLEGGK